MLTYNPENLPALEEYVRDQMANNTTDRTANLAVLKLYQFNPNLTNISVVVSILALSLAALPDPDFNLSLCLLSEEIISDPSVAKLIEMQHLLEHCQFEQFWQLFESESAAAEDGEDDRLNLLRDYPEFDTCIRKFISSTLASAYHSISVPLLQVYLNLEGEDLADWITVIGASFNHENAGLVDFPSSKETVKPVVVQETIRFEQLTKIIGVGRLQ
ncbi:Eukaryotic translation initiation factor 3 subunit K [Phlyctochytrium bullatum]|nr:Eukaryotic translation initiation factor 3 subunit K [Phlyctochytrium bullatum]